MNHRKMKRGFGKLGFICLALLICLAGTGVAYAAWTDTLTIEGTITTGEWDCGGTIGFWKNWDNHRTFEEEDIGDWLGAINATSVWLVPDMDEDDDIDIEDMEIVLEGAQGGTPKKKFLGHYLATRLNAESGRLHLNFTHDVTTKDPSNYLNLTNVESATLSEIIVAIEDKPVPPAIEPPTDKQFEIMKNICDALNNLEI